MRHTLIIILLFISLNALSQDIFTEEREPIVVETKADLQTELELQPISYFREELPDSLLKFNYSYHGKPVRSDYNLFPGKPVKWYLNLSSGNKDVVDATNYLAFGNFSQKANYLMRNDKGDREATSFNLDNNYFYGNHNFNLGYIHLFSSKESNIIETEYKSNNLNLAYAFSPLESKLFVNNLSVNAQYETNKDTLKQTDKYWNIFSELQLEPLPHFFLNLNFANHHDVASGQASLFYEDYAKLGIWAATTPDDKIIVAPNVNLFLNYHSFTFLLNNRPCIKHTSFVEQYQQHLYGNYTKKNLDSIMPGNAVAEISYFNLLTWSLGFNYQYVVDSPVYRLETAEEGIQHDSYWLNSAYAKFHYQIKNFDISLKSESISYNNFSAEFLPFIPEWRFTVKATQAWNKLSVGLEYINESAAVNDHNITLDDSHILNLYGNYRLTNSISLWTELLNLANRDNNAYFHDEIKQVEFKAGMKIFF